MTIQQIKDAAGDYATASRWAIVDNDGERRQLRIIGIGRTKIRLMAGDGRTVTTDPQHIAQVW